MSIYTKILLIIIFSIISIYGYLFKKKFLLILFIILSIIFTLLIFINEYIFIIFYKIKIKDIDGAKKYLKFIKNPKKQLIKIQQSYFFFLKGLINSMILNINGTEKYMKKSLRLGLNINYFKIIANLNLAIIYAKKKNKKYKKLLNESKKLDNLGLLKKEIKKIEIIIKNILKKNINNNI